VPVVARGAGTGLSGGAMPHTLGVTLSLAKFNRILKIDPVSRTAVVQCGVRNLAISEAAAPFNLYYAPDPSSQIACTIGGNVAENSGGVHCLKYGLTLHNVLRVRGFTADGEAIEFGGDALDAPGLDLLALVVGSEGMLAVTTEVTVKLVPKPQLARCIMASFDDVRKAGDAVAAVIAAGIIPAGLEMMDKPMTAAVEDFVRAGYDLVGRGHPAVRVRRHARRGRRRNRPHDRRAARLRRHRHRGEQQRRRAHEVLERAQERVSGLGPHQPRLHVPGLDHPAQAAGRHSPGHPGDGEKVQPALLQRVPRGRRQPAPAGAVRCQRPRRAAPLRAVRRRHPGDQRGHGRHRVGRARRGRGKAQQHVRAVHRVERVRAAAADATPLRIRGGGTKDFYGEAPQGELLDTRALAASRATSPASWS
jgi:FAD/FMN-containing dehydrogenase